HVHLSFAKPGDVARGGVTAVLDLGAPADYAFAEHPPVRFRATGPLLTAPGGYPTRSWGANGYGLAVHGPEQARTAVATLAQRGAAMIKVALHGEPALDEDTLHEIVDAAHARSVRAVAHALTVEAVRRAAAAGADALAHTPVEPLPGDVAAACGRRHMTVISTVRAFGDGRAARDNLAALDAAGCTVVYGTDLGNEDVAPGADPDELRIVAAALGSADAAWRAATSAGASFAGFDGGCVAEGAPADLVLLDELDFDALRTPRAVLIGGERVA
ncbi:MAG: amidohydrolase family protein, partial [Actinomycetota bacterium]